jgi:hypothetical protein
MGDFDKYSFRLFSRPSFVEGVARTLDISGIFDSYNQNKQPGSADRNALLSDWLATGIDLRESIKRYGEQEA